MKDPRDLDRVRQYLNVHSAGVQIKGFLGDGTDGTVWATARGTAVKVFKAERGYFNERDSYQRLAEYGVTEQLEGFWVAEMHGWDDRILAIEMDLMQQPPYVIDFAKVRIDRPPDFSPETLRDAEEMGRELFEDNWPVVTTLMAALESFQIYYLDPKPQNIVFPQKPRP